MITTDSNSIGRDNQPLLYVLYTCSKSYLGQVAKAAQGGRLQNTEAVQGGHWQNAGAAWGGHCRAVDV